MSFKFTGKVKFFSFLTGAGIIYMLRDVIANSLFFMLLHDFGITGIAVLDLCLVSIGSLAVISFFNAALKAGIYKIINCEAVIGFNGIYAYARNLSEVPLHRLKFLTVLIIPPAVISLAALLLPTWAGGLVQILNLLRSRREIIMAAYLFKVNGKYQITENSGGFDAVQHNDVKKEESMAA